jgi:ABC-type cobalt transport system substrate-binding protein
MKRLAVKLLAIKLLTVAAAILALTAMPAQAQMGGRHHGDDNKKAEPVKKVDEKAYKAALERIPEPKEKYDPWAVAKPADAAKDTAKKPKTP